MIFIRSVRDDFHQPRLGANRSLRGQYNERNCKSIEYFPRNHLKAGRYACRCAGACRRLNKADGRVLKILSLRKVQGRHFYYTGIPLPLFSLHFFAIDCCLHSTGIKPFR